MLLTKETPGHQYFNVFLNGENINHLAVTEANEEAGYVICLDLEELPPDKDAKKTIRRYKRGPDMKPLTYMLRGIVHCEIQENAPAVLYSGATRNGQRYEVTTKYTPYDAETRTYILENI